jgi:hypothetical protein
MRARLIAVAVLLASVGAMPAAAQTRFGGELSWGDDSDFGLGGRVVLGLENYFRAPIDAHLSFDYFFPSAPNGVDVTYWEVNLDGGYRIPGVHGPINVYAGGGLNIAHGSANGNGNSDVGVNLLGGVQFKTKNRLLPFVEARVELGGGDQFVLTGGLLF